MQNVMYELWKICKKFSVLCYLVLKEIYILNSGITQ